MAGTLPPLKVEIVANTTAFTKSLTTAASALEKIASVAKGASEGLDLVAAAADKVAEPLAALAEAAKNARTQLSGIASATKRIATAAEAAGTAVAENFTVLAEAAATMSANVKASTTEAGEAIAAMGEEAKAAGLGLAAMGEDIVASMQAAAVEIRAASAEMRTSMASLATTAEETAAKTDAASESMMGKFLGLDEVGKQLKAVLPLTIAAVGFESVKMATTFQGSTTRLVSSAGEIQSNLALVRSGMLSMAGQVGVSADELSQAMYYVEAAGYHGAQGLTALKAAAEGAAAEGADTTDVAKALTDVLKDYHLAASQSATVTSQMITAVAHGKVNLEDFSKAFASIIPAASAAGISFADAGSALAEMTNHGFSASRASQNLAQALRSLLNPTKPMITAFQEYGVSADTLKAKLHGPDGLTDAMQYLSEAASKAGKEGTPEFAAALKLLMGTAPGANAALATVGANFSDTTATIKAMSGATADANGKVQGFALVQQTLGQQLKELRAGFDSVMIRIGDGLIPLLSDLFTLIESRGEPAFKSFTNALSGLASGFTGSAQKKKDAGGPNLNGWQQAGATLRSVFGDLAKIMGQLFTILGHVWTALAPLAALLGGAFLGALKAVSALMADYVGPVLVAFSGFLAKNKDLITVLLGLFAAWKIASALVAVQTAILNAVLDANPIGLVVLAVGLLVAALVMLWQHSQTARDVLSKVFAGLGIPILAWVQLSLQAFKLVIGAFLEFVTTMVDLAAKAFGWVPGVGSKLKQASKDLQGYTDDSQKFFDGAIGKVGEWKQQLAALPTTVQIQGNIDDLTKKVNDAKAQLDDKNLPSSKKLVLVADISNWQNQILKAKLQLAQTPTAKKAVLTAQITDWQNQINQAVKQLKDAPASKKAYLTADINALQSNVAAAKASLASIPNRTVTVTYQAVNHQAVSTTGFTYAKGGIHIPGLRAAATGLMDRQAGFASSPILWAEAGPEAYIPLDPGKRARSRQIASETVGVLGGQVSWDGGRSLAMAGASPVSGAATGAGAMSGVSVVNNINIAGSVITEKQLRDVVQKQMLQLGARNSETYQKYQR